MLYGSFVWNLAMPFYRPLGIIMGIMAIGVGDPGLVGPGDSEFRRGLVTLLVIAVGLKLVHWGYYVPEWNYRYSQGPWGRAIGQWVPKRWTLYTFHDWPPDLAFFMKRPVRQLRSPHYLEYQPARQASSCLAPIGIRELAQVRPADHRGRETSRSVGGERILARTAGPLPPPFGPGPPRFGRRTGIPIRRVDRQTPAIRWHRDQSILGNTRHFVCKLS